MGGSEPATNEVEETPLSRKQLEILQNRENFLQDFTVPELKEHLQKTKDIEFREDFQISPYMKTLSSNIGNIRDQFQFQEDNMSLNLAKRGLEQSGVEAQSLSQLANAEAQAVGSSVTQTQLQQILERNGVKDQKNNNSLTKQNLMGSSVQGLLSLAPRPTSASPQQMVQEPGEEGALGGTLSGAMTGASTGAMVGGPWGAVIGGVVGAGAGYASST